jgi:diguanylate cyclase (GGDEF)-like protein
MSSMLRRTGAPRASFLSRFDTRTAMVIISATGALPLLAIALVSPTFLRSGALPLLTVIVVFTAITVLFAVRMGRLSDRQFTVLGSGGMVGVAISAFLIADPGGTRAVTSMLAVVPAIAASGSPPRVTAALTTASVAMATWLSIISLSSSGVAVTMVAVGAAATTVLVPVVLIVALRRSLQAVNERLNMLANTDPLTGLLNRRGILGPAGALLDRTSTEGGQISALVVDIDHFKSVNDRLGHAAGDRVLVTIADALNHSIEATGSDDAIISRIGGEEFLVLVPLVPDRALEQAVLDHVRAECDGTVSVGSVTAEIRTTLDPELIARISDDCSYVEGVIDTLMRAADNALYDAKRGGRDRMSHAGTLRVSWATGRSSERARPDTVIPGVTH